MKVVLQDMRTGQTLVADTPQPACGRTQVLVQSTNTLISAGTERMLVAFGRANWIERARMQPERVRAALAKASTDGVLPTLEAVKARIDRPLPLGYCNVGRVLEVGADVQGFARGDRVASNGGHAGVVAVSGNLCVRVPDTVSDPQAAFTVAGAIALQGVRLAAPALGETVAVIGLGLIGLITVQLLRAQGCRVFGVDLDPERLALARRFGATCADLRDGEPLRAAEGFSRGHGMDAVIIAASTQSSAPVAQAAAMARKRGRIVLVGATGTALARDAFYRKELSFQVSCSYGPGRYDPLYEEAGQDYPLPFVRWTAQRNFEAVLDMMADGRLDMEPLVSHRFDVGDAEQAYALVTGGEPSLGVLLLFPPEAAAAAVAAPAFVLDPERVATPRKSAGPPCLGFIGAGSHATAVLMPAFAAAGAVMAAVASSGGVSAWHAARRFGFAQLASDAGAVLGDPAVEAVVIATRHADHAALTAQALLAGRHVFIEKPLAVDRAGLDAVAQAWQATRALPHPPQLLVGLNRRFAPHAVALKALLLRRAAPAHFIVTVNAGALAPGHWAGHAEHGGRIVGEACHFVDLLRFLAGAPITETLATGTAGNASLHLAFAGGSHGTIHYFADGARAYPKERLEVFCGGAVARIDNWRRLEGFGWPGLRSMRRLRQDKGHGACAAAFLRAVRSGEPPVPFEEMREVARATLDLAEALRP